MAQAHGVTSAEEFCAQLEGRGYGVVAGVPCSYFQGPISQLSRADAATRLRYIPAASEGAALAAAIGARVGGTKSVVLAQNSGFGNLINPLTSLSKPFEVGCLLFLSWRGDPQGLGDEPQHLSMGSLTPAMLDLLGIRHWVLPNDDFGSVLDQAEEVVSRGQLACVLVRKGAISKRRDVAAAEDDGIDPGAALAAINATLSDEFVFSTTGYLSRRLFSTNDRERNFYMPGSMGHVAALALGFAAAHEGDRVVVLDGDGAALMHMGTMSTVGYLAPSNFVHVVFDNQAYESTGSQASTTISTNLEGVAESCGYRSAVRIRALDNLAPAIQRTRASEGPHLVLVRVRNDAKAEPARPTSDFTLLEMRDRFLAAQ